MRPFEALRIVEIAGSVAGAYAAKIFSDYGATVIKVEPPEGDPLRSEGEPLVLPNGDVVGTTWAYLNTSKRSIRLEATDETGLARLLSGAHAVIESSSPDNLTSRVPHINNEHLVRTQICHLVVQARTRHTVRIYLPTRRLEDSSTQMANLPASLSDDQAFM